jgi:nickel/cobalt exporter
MVSAGVIAALGVRHVGERWQGLSSLMRRAPYISGALILCIALYVGWQGVRHLA